MKDNNLIYKNIIDDFADGVAMEHAHSKPIPRKILFFQRQSPGDILTMTRAVADFKAMYPQILIDVHSPANEIFENNPHLTPISDNDPDAEKFEITYDDIHISGWHGLHFSDAFHNDMEKKTGLPFPKTGFRPELFISDQEKLWTNQVEVEFGYPGPFWLINAGRKGDNELKHYHRWAEVADLFNNTFRGSVRLVQIGHKDHIHAPLPGVYNLVGRTDLRQLIRLGYWAHGTIGPISFQFVMSAALQQPHVVVAGGKEGVRWHIYPHGRYLYSNGCLKCCGWDGCWLGGEIGKCRDLVYGVPHCFWIITPEEIVDAVRKYYDGGMLNMERGK